MSQIMKFIMLLLIFAAFSLGIPSDTVKGQGTSYLPQFERPEQPHAAVQDSPKCAIGPLMRFETKEQFETIMYHRSANYDIAVGYWNPLTIIEITPLYEDADYAPENKASWVIFFHHARVVGEEIRWDLPPSHYYVYEYEPAKMWSRLELILLKTKNSGGLSFQPTCNQ